MRGVACWRVEYGLLEVALADGGGGDDEGAVGDGGGEGVVAGGRIA